MWRDGQAGEATISVNRSFSRWLWSLSFLFVTICNLQYKPITSCSTATPPVSCRKASCTDFRSCNAVDITVDPRNRDAGFMIHPNHAFFLRVTLMSTEQMPHARGQGVQIHMTLRCYISSEIAESGLLGVLPKCNTVHTLLDSFDVLY